MKAVCRQAGLSSRQTGNTNNAKSLNHCYKQKSALIKHRKENTRMSVKNPFLFEERIIYMNLKKMVSSAQVKRI
jgi:hypothetical protein